MKTFKWIFSLVAPVLIGVFVLITFIFSANRDSDQDRREASISSTKAGSLKNKDQTESGLAQSYSIHPLTLPKNIDFAGEEVPLYDNDVKERLDRELLVNTYWQSHTLLLIKRANRMLPVIEDILEKNGIPKDFKYLPIAESDLKNVVSPAGAVGIWQFIESTGKERGLEIRDQVDERYDLKKATEAACAYLKEAYDEFGNWTLVAASYNLGISGVKRALNRQEVESYYDMKLNPETSRYVFRILAMKEILEHPSLYGFNVKESDLYQPLEKKTIEVSSSVGDWVDFAKQHNIAYKTLKNFNPWIRRKSLKNPSGKVYQVEIPIGAAQDKGQGRIYREDTMTGMPKAKAKAIHGDMKKPSYKIHEVAKGQTIYKIAKNYQVRVSQIMEWNNLNTHFVKRGQTLKILEKAID